MSKNLTEQEKVAGGWMISGILGVTLALGILVGWGWALLFFSLFVFVCGFVHASSGGKHG